MTTSPHRDTSSPERMARENVPASPIDDNALIGQSEAMSALGEVLAKTASSDVNVLITGETGTGKELVARLLHERSARRDGPFIALNCASVPGRLLESELFGHAAGAFEGASADKIGLFERAHGGSLFLEEIAEISLDMQAKLLRVLQERKVRPVGGTDEREIDVRLLAATTQPLKDAIKDGRFREDLFFRLNVTEVSLPPLRERGEDVLLLADHFLKQLAESTGQSPKRLDDGAKQALRAYDWPGNVRELHTCVQRAATAASGEVIRADDLPAEVRGGKAQSASTPLGIIDTRSLPRLSVIERRYIRHVLRETDGNKTRAAELLGIDRRTLHRKLKRMNGAGDTGG